MKVLGSSSDQVGSNSAVAAEALACGSDFALFALANGHSVESPALSAVSHPTLLAIGWGNPDASGFATVLDQQRPFGVEGDDVAVGNDLGSKWVYDNQVVFAQNQFWSKPKDAGSRSQEHTEGNVKSDVAVGAWVSNGLEQESSVEGESHATPNEVGFWSKDREILHTSIIADATLGGKGK